MVTDGYAADHIPLGFTFNVDDAKYKSAEHTNALCSLYHFIEATLVEGGSPV